jgi:Txe/YoeB family toxin of Txe-Axe toxin-antitoxin module
LRLALLPNGWGDYLYWQENDRKILQRVNEVNLDTKRDSSSGIGKPGPLKTISKVGGQEGLPRSIVSSIESKATAS